MFRLLSDFSITKRAVQQGRLSLNLLNPRDFAQDKHQTVDDSSYGGGPGMVMMYQPLMSAIKQAHCHHRAQGGKKKPRVIYLSPQGKPFTHVQAKQWASYSDLILLCGRYEGIDERVIDQAVDEEVSIGDYVLTGGELPAMVVLDAIMRFLPGVLGNPQSVCEDTFSHGLCDYPHYTRPQRVDDLSVPEVLCSGDHEAIRLWRLEQALGNTWLKRPDLLKALSLTEEQAALLKHFIASHRAEKGDDLNGEQDA